jgi:hypothetical protein
MDVGPVILLGNPLPDSPESGLIRGGSASGGDVLRALVHGEVLPGKS